MAARVSCGVSEHSEEPQFEGSDPLRAAVALPFETLLFPYGFPARIRSNCSAVLRAAERSWATYPARFHVDPLEVRIIVSDVAGSAHRALVAPCFRAQGNLLTLVSDRENSGCCDLNSGFGAVYVSRATSEDEEHLRYHFLDAITYTLLEGKHLATVHAACVGINDCGVLLAGKPGSGKSSLAYACALRGWTFVSDDASSLLIGSETPTVVGNSHAFRFRPSAASLFPELRGKIKNRSGLPTLEVRTEQFRSVNCSSESRIRYVMFLNRADCFVEPEVVSLSQAELFHRLFKNPWPPELSMQKQRATAIERLSNCPGYELRYRDLNSVVQILEHITARTC